MSSSSIRIVVLPDAGAENPFQYEMVNFLRQNQMEVIIGKKYALGSTYQALKQHKPTFLYYDWVHSFIIGKSFGWSLLKSLAFVIEILMAKNIYKVKIVHTLHNLQNHAGIWLGLERKIYGFFLRQCNHIRVYSEEVKRQAISKFGLKEQRVSVIQDVPYHYYYPNLVDKQTSRKKLGIEEDKFVYLFFGELKPYKGINDLLTAYGELEESKNCLIIAGKSYDTQYWEQLTAKAKDNTNIQWFHRFIEKEEVQFFFNAADVVVLPFMRIDHSGSIDLAMSFSKPIVTLRTDATERLLGHQLPLLFDNHRYSLKNCLQIVRESDLKSIGRRNFEIADTTNYQDLVKLFKL